MILFGTIINVLTIIAGSIIGLIFHSKLPKRIIKIVFQGLGLFTFYVGITMTMKTQNILILIFSVVIGSALGEWLRIDKYLDRFSDFLKRKLKSSHESFSEGMITAFLLYCIGSMTIIGAFEEGTMGKSDLLIAKSIMDGFSSIALSSALGIGVLFSIVPLFLFQGGLTLLAFGFGNLMPEMVVNEMSAAGGILLLGLGIKLLEVKDIKVVNMLPSLLIAIGLAYLFIYLNI